MALFTTSCNINLPVPVMRVTVIAKTQVGTAEYQYLNE